MLRRAGGGRRARSPRRTCPTSPPVALADARHDRARAARGRPARPLGHARRRSTWSACRRRCSRGRSWPARWRAGSSATWRPGSGSASCSSCSRWTCCPSAPSRYPDYGPATVAAVALAAGAPWELGLGISVAARSGARGAGRLEPAAGAALERARDSAARGRARRRGEPARSGGCSTAGSCATRLRGALLTALGLRWRAGARRAGSGSTAQTAVGLTLVAIGAGARRRRSAARSGARAEAPGSSGCWPALALGILAGGAPMNGGWRALLRLFAVQGTWNYERMLGVGMGYAAEPLLEDLKTVDPVRHGEAVVRSAEFFNCNPEPGRAGARAPRRGPSTRRCPARRSRGSAPRSAARWARWATSSSGRDWCRRSSGLALVGRGAGRRLVGDRSASCWPTTLVRVVDRRAGRSGPGSTPGMRVGARDRQLLAAARDRAHRAGGRVRASGSRCRWWPPGICAGFGWAGRHRVAGRGRGRRRRADPLVRPAPDARALRAAGDGRSSCFFRWMGL